MKGKKLSLLQELRVPGCVPLCSNFRKENPTPFSLQYFVLAVFLLSENSSLVPFTLIPTHVFGGVVIGSKGEKFIPCPLGLHLLNLPNFIEVKPGETLFCLTWELTQYLS